jgi:phage-related protein
MNKYSCIYYTLPSGRVPVQEFIESLHTDTQDAFFYKVELLETFGPQLRKPHTDNIGEGIFELRFVGKEGQTRVLFFFYHHGRIVFTNGFIKKVKKTPPREIELAGQRRKDYLQRGH